MRILASLFLAVALSGCLFEQAPTGPSRSVNTWLFGVWEHTDEDGKYFRAGVMPHVSDRYILYLRRYDKNKRSIGVDRYEAWISRVGQATFLVVEVPQPEGTRYALLGVQLLSPRQLRIRIPQIDPAITSPFQMRVAIRRAFKNGELFSDTDVGSIWDKIGEIYWQDQELAAAGDRMPADPTAQPLLPLRTVRDATTVGEETEDPEAQE